MVGELVPVGVLEAVGVDVKVGARVPVGRGTSVSAKAEIVRNAVPVACGVRVALATGVAEGVTVFTAEGVPVGDGIRVSVGAVILGAAVLTGQPSATNTVRALVAPFKGMAAAIAGKGAADIRAWYAHVTPIAAPNSTHTPNPNPINPISFRRLIIILSTPIYFRNSLELCQAIFIGPA